MSEISSLIHQHPAISLLVAYYVFSSIVGGMPSPDEKSSSGYKWAFNTLHIMAGNLARIPQLRSIVGLDGQSGNPPTTEK